VHASRLGPRSVFCTRLRVTPLTSGTVRELAKPLGSSACEPLARTGREPSVLVWTAAARRRRLAEKRS